MLRGNANSGSDIAAAVALAAADASGGFTATAIAALRGARADVAVAVQCGFASVTLLLP